MSKKAMVLVTLFVMFGALVLAACQPTVEQVEVTRVVTETVVEEGQTVEVTKIVEQIVEVTAVPTEVPTQPKDLVVCMAQEPDTLYTYGGSMLAATAVKNAVFNDYITEKSFAYQPQGLEKLPSLADGDALLNQVDVAEGDTVRTADDVVKALEVGDVVTNSDGEDITFDGTPITVDQMVVDFTMLPTVWSDGTPVQASDSVYSFNVASDPDTPSVKYATERTASYEATGDLSTRWTGVPGFRDSTYFTNFWGPLPEHVLGGFSAAELLEAPEASRTPVGDGPFRIVEWIAGDSIRLEPNEFYYRADEGLPYLDSLTYKFIPDTNQLVAQLLSGQCDIGTQDGLSTSDAPFLIEAEASGLLVPYFQTGTVYEHVDFNIEPFGDAATAHYPWFQDVKVRQAMTMCTDRQSMVDNIMYGRSEVINTYVPTVHPLYPTEGVTEWPFDVDAANALLDEAGYDQRDADGFRLDPNGERFAPTLGTTAGNAMREQILQIFKENQAACGIDVELYFLPSTEWFADGPEGPLFGRQTDLGEFAWVTGVEPSCSLYLSTLTPGPEGEIFEPNGQPYGGWGGQSQTGYYSPEFDAACQAALGSLPGTDEYVQAHMEAQRIFSNDVPVIPMFLRLIVAAARPEVLNFQPDPTAGSEMYNIQEIDLQQ